MQEPMPGEERGTGTAAARCSSSEPVQSGWRQEVVRTGDERSGLRPRTFRSHQGVMGPAQRCMPTSRAAARRYIFR